jgi:ASC-1-like (ASCH) protein
MDHVAILSRKGRWLEKILSGEKTIESRWYVARFKPYKAIKTGDTVYFKESCMPVTAKATTEKVLFFDELNKSKIEKIIREYSGIAVDKSFANEVKDKNYCVLVFLKDVKEIKPFEIDKAGYGNASAWLTMDNIKLIKR